MPEIKATVEFIDYNVVREFEITITGIDLEKDINAYHENGREVLRSGIKDLCNTVFMNVKQVTLNDECYDCGEVLTQKKHECPMLLAPLKKKHNK